MRYFVLMGFPCRLADDGRWRSDSRDLASFLQRMTDHFVATELSPAHGSPLAAMFNDVVERTKPEDVEFDTVFIGDPGVEY